MQTPKPKQVSGSCWEATYDGRNEEVPPPEVKIHAIDVKACRRSALLLRAPRIRLGCDSSKPRGLPLFAVTDQLENVGNGSWQDCVFVWLELDCCPDDPEVYRRVMPFHGTGLYTVETAECLVNIGVVQAASITKGLTASYHLDQRN